MTVTMQGPTLTGVSLRPDHPALAVIAPPRLDRFRELLALRPDEEIEADFTGWSKLVLLTEEWAVLFPRDHTQVDALRRELVALEAISRLELPGVPRVHVVWDDPALSAHVVAVEHRLPGVPLSGLVESMPLAALGDLFAALGRAAAGWHAVDVGDLDGALPRRWSLDERTLLVDELELDAGEAGTAAAALHAAQQLEPVLVHADLHEGQLLVTPEAPHTITGILDWQTARIDHPFVELDLGEWGTALWRGHRPHFPELRRRAWAAYGEARGLAPELGLVFEWHHAASHARRMLGRRPFPVTHAEGVVGTLAEARDRVRAALAALAVT